MNIRETISQLENLRGHCENFIEPSNENCIWKKDVEALEVAIKLLKGEDVKNEMD